MGKLTNIDMHYIERGVGFFKEINNSVDTPAAVLTFLLIGLVGSLHAQSGIQELSNEEVFDEFNRMLDEEGFKPACLYIIDLIDD